MKRVFDSIHEAEEAIGKDVIDRNVGDRTLFICFDLKRGYILHEYKLGDKFSIEEELDYDDLHNHDTRYIYVKVNHHLHTQIEREEFTNKIIGCEFMRSDFILPYRQFVHTASWLNGELVILDQENRPSLFRTCKFYIDNETLVDSREFEKFIKGE